MRDRYERKQPERLSHVEIVYSTITGSGPRNDFPRGTHMCTEPIAPNGPMDSIWDEYVIVQWRAAAAERYPAGQADTSGECAEDEQETAAPTTNRGTDCDMFLLQETDDPDCPASETFDDTNAELTPLQAAAAIIADV